MEYSFLTYSLILVTCLLSLSACQNSEEMEDEISHLDEILSIPKHYVTPHSLLVMSNDNPELWDMATVTGQTSTSIPYVPLTDTTYCNICS